MTPAWSFYPKTETTNHKNPVSGDFFSTEAVHNAAVALVREGIQNSLDARTNPAKAAHVRLYLSELDQALDAQQSQRWFGSLWPHVEAVDSGITNAPSLNRPCPFMVFEDFETTGLRGDPQAHDREPGVRNDFFNFFRAEGVTDKSSHDGGSRGVGKIVFCQSSLVRSSIGFTIRADDHRALLMGRSILRFHRVGSQSFTSEGYFGVPRQPTGFMLPCEEPALHDEFRKDFRIARRTEPGLTLVVPWYDRDDEDGDGLTPSGVFRAVLEGYFYPILMGHLRVTLDAPSSHTSLDSDSISDVVGNLGDDFKRFYPLLKLAEWACTLRDDEHVTLNPPEPMSSHQWSADLVTPEIAQTLRDALAQRKRFALKVPVTIRPKGASPQSSSFRIYLEHSDDDAQKPVFIRDHLIITAVAARPLTQVRALVIADHGPLALLLRKAEGVAHTEWNARAEGFKEAYTYGNTMIRFVQESVTALLRIVQQQEHQPDPTVNIDLLSIPAPPEVEEVSGRRRKPKPKPGQDSDGPIKPPLPTPRRFRVQSLKGGFAIVPGNAAGGPPGVIDIRVAYEVRRGNALNKYHPADFDLGQKPIRHEIQGQSVEVKSAEGNRMLIAIKQPDFRIEVKGFDPDRDILVSAKAREPARTEVGTGEPVTTSQEVTDDR